MQKHFVIGITAQDFLFFIFEKMLKDIGEYLTRLCAHRTVLYLHTHIENSWRSEL